MNNLELFSRIISKKLIFKKMSTSKNLSSMNKKNNTIQKYIIQIFTSKSLTPSGKAPTGGSGPLITNLNFLASTSNRSPISTSNDLVTLNIKDLILWSKFIELSRTETLGWPTHAYKIKTLFK